MSLEPKTQTAALNSTPGQILQRPLLMANANSNTAPRWTYLTSPRNW